MTSLVAIGELVEAVNKVDPARAWPDRRFAYIDIAAVDQNSKAIVAPQQLDSKEAPSRARQLVAIGDVLVSTVRPNLNAVAQVTGAFDGAIASTGFTVLRARPGLLDSRYLLHWVRSPTFVGEMTRRATGASYPAVSDQIVKASEIPLPPLEEQRRIAAVLDRADQLRAKRRLSFARLDALKGAAFVEICGAAGEGTTAALVDLLAKPLRNGTSPATRGTVSATVLTLSAITGNAFNPAARKEARFASEPPADKRVSRADLLICRGNGNRSLVGRGFFPSEDLADVVFPDTVIAARVDGSIVEAAFLEHVWATPHVRRQIEALAKTTNGTYKVNQSMLESIQVPYPGLQEQRRFAAIASKLKAQRQRCDASMASLEEMFSGVQGRAFSGQL